MGRGRLRIRQDALRKVLGISDTTEIVDFYRTLQDVERGTFSMVVRGPDVPDAHEGPIKGKVTIRKDGRRFMTFEKLTK